MQEMEKLTRLIYGSLSPQHLSFTSLAKQEALKIAGQLQLHLMVQYHAVYKKKRQLHCVRLVQSFCVQMTNLLQQYMAMPVTKAGSKPAEKNGFVFYGVLQNCFLQVLDFLTDYFENEINPLQKIPQIKQQQLIHSFSQQLARLETIAGDVVDGSLLRLLQESVNTLTTGERCYYGHYLFWQHCLNRLEKNEQISTERWITMLINHNFNDTRFLKWLMDFWKNDTVNMQSTSEQTAYWTNKYRWLDTQHTIANPLHPASVNCIQMIRDAIDFETDIVMVGTNTQGDLPDKPIETNLSVSQLGLFLRLQVDTNMIRAENKAALIRQVAAQYKTTRVTGISGENLYKKFYTCDPAAVSIMRTYLSEMLNKLKSY